MRKIGEVLRLRFDLGLGQRAIARACSISQSAVHEYLNRAAYEAGIRQRYEELMVEAIKAKNPHARVGFIGAHVAVLPGEGQGLLIVLHCQIELPQLSLRLRKFDENVTLRWALLKRL